jgi:hypothetical protein
MAFWQYLRASQRRKSELRRISRILGQPASLSVEMLFSDAKGNALQDLLDLILGDPTLFSLLQRYDASREDLQEFYHALLVAGAGQWVCGHWVAASALCYGFTLEFVLARAAEGRAARRTPREIWQDAAFTLVEYFAKGRLGRVQRSAASSKRR